MKRLLRLERYSDHFKSNNITVVLFVISLLILIFSLFLYPTNSTDLGWHLRYGEYFAQNGRILKENIFSYTMPDFVWVNHSWLYDVVVYQLFKIGSFNLLSIAAAISGVLVTFILYKISKVNLISFLIAFIPFYLLAFITFQNGFKAQTVSLLCLAITVWLVREVLVFKHPLYIILSIFLLFVFWANWHGEYMIGLAYIFLFSIGKTIDEHKNTSKVGVFKILTPLLVAGVMGSLVNPFGIASHIQGIVHAFSSRLSGIDEWKSWPASSWQWWLLLSYTGFIWWKVLHNSKLRRFEVLIPLALFNIQAILHRRTQGAFAVISFPLLIEIIQGYRFNFKLKAYQLWVVSFLFIFLSIQIMNNHQPWIKNWNGYCQSGSAYCSESMLEYLKSNQIKGKIFNFYNWGGYLIWNYPQEKVYIDGRMAIWKDPVTGFMPYGQYEQIMTADNKGLEIFQNLGFDYALLYPGSQLEEALISKLGWVAVYRDRSSVVLKPMSIYN